jgi:hypothetical protein
MLRRDAGLLVRCWATPLFFFPEYSYTGQTYQQVYNTPLGKRTQMVEKARSVVLFLFLRSAGVVESSTASDRAWEIRHTLFLAIYQRKSITWPSLHASYCTITIM